MPSKGAWLVARTTVPIRQQGPSSGSRRVFQPAGRHLLWPRGGCAVGRAHLFGLHAVPGRPWGRCAAGARFLLPVRTLCSGICLLPPGGSQPRTFSLGNPGRAPREALCRVRPPKAASCAKGTPHGFPFSRTLDNVDEVDG